MLLPTLITGYLAIMQNNLDADAVDDVICGVVPILHADCSSCSCCGEFCCSEDDESSSSCSFNYELDTSRSISIWPICRRYRKVYAWAKDPCSEGRPSGGRPGGGRPSGGGPGGGRPSSGRPNG